MYRNLDAFHWREKKKSNKEKIDIEAAEERRKILEQKSLFGLFSSQSMSREVIIVVFFM